MLRDESIKFPIRVSNIYIYIPIDIFVDDTTVIAAAEL